MHTKYPGRSAAQWFSAVAFDIALIAALLWLPQLSNPAYAETFYVAAFILYSVGLLALGGVKLIAISVKRKLRRIRAYKDEPLPTYVLNEILTAERKGMAVVAKIWSESAVRGMAADNLRIGYSLASEAVIIGLLIHNGLVFTPTIAVLLLLIWTHGVLEARYMFRARGYTA